MALTPRGLHRFGQLYLDRDVYADRQIIPGSWVRRSTRSYVRDTFHGFAYGYYWWIGTFDGVRVQFAWGHGGQYVFVVPRGDLVVPWTAANRPGSDGNDPHSERVRGLLEEYLLPASRSQ